MTAPRQHRNGANGPDAAPAPTDLRRRAEQQLRGEPVERRRERLESDAHRLVHELQVHQIELEMQNSELKEARARTESLLEKYTDLYEFAPVGYFSLTARGQVRLVNLAGARLVGLERARLLGRTLAALVADESRTTVTGFLRRVFAGEGKQSCTAVIAVPGGPRRVVNIEAERSLNREECLAVVEDITERTEAEDKVRISEVRYRRLFEAAHDGVVLLDPVTRKITDTNPFMTKLLGYPRDQLIGKELYEIGLLQDEAASQEMFQKLKRDHEVRYEDLPLESQRGRHQEVEVVANLYQENGHAVIQCNIRDITVRKLAETLLRQNEALFANLIEQAPVGIYVVDDQLKLVRVNPRALPVFSKVRPLLGRDFLSAVRIMWPRRIADEIFARFQHTLRTGEPYFSPEFSERRRDSGQREIYEWQIQRITLPAGQQGVVCFFSDITERKKAEANQLRVELLAAENEEATREIARRREVEKSLRLSELTQRGLLAESRELHAQLRHLTRQLITAQEDERKTISRELHDEVLQTLVGINVELSVLARGTRVSLPALRQKIAHTRQMVVNSVNAVHQFARELRPAVLDDFGLIPALQAYVKGLAARNKLKVRLTSFDGIEAVPIAQRTVLFRVAQEALTNVARHAHATQVTVRLSRRGGRVRMEIGDNGRSFPVAAVLQARSPKRLGLVGMKERIEMVGGKLGIESQPGQGTTVHVELPPPLSTL